MFFGEPEIGQTAAARARDNTTKQHRVGKLLSRGDARDENTHMQRVRCSRVLPGKVRP